MIRHTSRLALFALALTSASAQAALVGYWPLDGNANAVVGTNGVLNNGVSVGTDRNGAPGGALSFNGALQQFVSIAGGGGLDGAQQGTISMWVQWNGTQDAACCGGTAGNVLGRQNNSIFSNNIIGLNNTNPAAGQVTAQVYNAGAPTVVGGPVVGSSYHHLALVFSPTEQKLYVDGTLVSTGAVNAGLNSNAGTPLAIGAWIGDGAGFSTSNIDDVAIFNRILPAGHITRLASQTATPLSLGAQIEGVTVTASSQLGGVFNRNANNLIDNLELTTTDPDGAAFVAGDGGMWLSVGVGFGQGTDDNPELTFNLGSIQPISEMAIYNYNEPANGDTITRGVDLFRVLVSNDNFGGDIRDLGIFDLAAPTGNANNPGQLFSLGNVQAQFVRFDILSNLKGALYPGAGNNGDLRFVGLNEVQFFRGTPVPEPASAALAMMGFLGLAGRRHRR